MNWNQTIWILKPLRRKPRLGLLMDPSFAHLGSFAKSFVRGARRFHRRLSGHLWVQKPPDTTHGTAILADQARGGSRGPWGSNLCQSHAVSECLGYGGYGVNLRQQFLEARQFQDLLFFSNCRANPTADPQQHANHSKSLHLRATWPSSRHQSSLAEALPHMVTGVRPFKSPTFTLGASHVPRASGAPLGVDTPPLDLRGSTNPLPGSTNQMSHDWTVKLPPKSLNKSRRLSSRSI